MNIKHIVEDFSFASGGVRTVVQDLSNHLVLNNVSSEIFTTRKENEDLVNFFPSKKGVALKWCYSKELGCAIEAGPNSSIQHVHGVWMYPQYKGLKEGVKQGFSTVFTPHGMLEPWLWKQGYWKKKLYFDSLLKQNIEKSDIVHAITPAERDNLHNLLKKSKRIEVLPNLISVESIPDIVSVGSCDKYILFLGRIHPKKGIDLLISAFSKIKDKTLLLKIVGKKNSYSEELIALVDSLGLSERVVFCGHVTGVDKFRLFKEAWVFVAPSFSEVVGMVNLEAGLMKTPVITTYQTGLLPDWGKNGGVLIHPQVDQLIQSLDMVSQWSDSERQERGNSLYDFIMKEYSWENKMGDWISLYNSL